MFEGISNYICCLEENESFHMKMVNDDASYECHCQCHPKMMFIKSVIVDQ